MLRLFLTASLACALGLLSGNPLFADSCITCHVKHDVRVKVPEVSPIVIEADGQKRAIGIPDAFKFHGHECPGVTTAFLAVKYGIELLYGDEIPKREDLIIMCPHPARGPIDLIDFVMKGDKQADRTWPVAGMKKSPDAFQFTLIRKSACLAVHIKLKSGLWPSDFFKMKRKQKKKSLTDKEWDKLHEYMKHIIMDFPVMQAVELFGTPSPYKTLIWGTIGPSEIDNNIKQLRRSKRSKGGPAKH